MYDFDKVLLKPNIEPMDTNTQRIRRNLMVASVVSYFFSVGSHGIDSSSSFIGIRFEALEPASIELLLLLALLYFLLHFLWASLDHLKENCLRLTGVAIPMARSGTYAGSSHTLEPNTNEARQSTIHSWWKGQQGLMKSYQSLLASMESNIEDGQHDQAMNSLKTRLEDLEHVAAYVEEALVRYERGFWHYQRGQIVRWVLFDFGVPVCIGVIAAFLMATELYPLLST